MLIEENEPRSQNTSTALPALLTFPGEQGGVGKLIPRGSVSSKKWTRLRGSLSTVRLLEMPASSLTRYSVPFDRFIFESAAAGAAKPSRSAAAAARVAGARVMA